MQNKKVWLILPVFLASLFLTKVDFAYGQEFAACINGSSVLTVNADGSGDCETIQDAIDNIANGGLISVGDGTYQENLVVLSKYFTLRGNVLDPSTVTIDANYLVSGIDIRSIPTDSGDMVIEGFNIINGRGTNGAGVYIYDAYANISSCIFSLNDATGSGGAIMAQYPSDEVTIEKSEIYSNVATTGGAIYVGYTQNGTFTIKNNVIYDNSSRDSGGAIYVGDNSSPAVYNNTFVRNDAANHGGVIYISAGSGNLNVINNVFYSNSASEGGAIYLDSYLFESIIDHNSFYLNNDNDFYIHSSSKEASQVGINNMTIDPLLTAVDSDDFTLTADSLLIDTGDDLRLVDVDDDYDEKSRPIGSAFDIGAYEYGEDTSDDFVSVDEDTEEEQLLIEQSFCTDGSGVIEERTYDSGETYSVCVFTDSSECELDLYYAGFCAIGDSLLEDQPVEIACGNFPDVSSADFTAEECAAITWAQDEEIFTGNDETGELKPSDEINRAETTKVLVETFGFELVYDSSTYTDVLDDSWYGPYIMSATENGIVEGYTDGSFKPESTVNKVEMLKILLETADIDLSEVDTSEQVFTDVPVDEYTLWYRPYAYFAYQNGLVDLEDDSEQIRASHILVGWDESEINSDRTKEEAYALISDILDQINSGEDFAELATMYSEDPGLTASGGDLGYFGKGIMVPEFEDAAFAIGEGEVSGIVETEFGYHIIKVTDRLEGTLNPHDGMLRKDVILALYRLQALGY
ncbi:MAG: peptidylprolyl isomerase [Candidatus Gracilibacteria bacterium]